MRKQATVRQSDVLGVLHGQDKPMTAYAILDQMKLGEPDLAAPTVYRALAALTDQGRAHKLESIKAFIPCRCNHKAAISAKSSFNATRHIVEVHGRCHGCTS